MCARLLPLDEACALVTTTTEIWAGGRHAAVTWNARERVSGSAPNALASHAVPDLRLDNHWIAI